MANPQKENGYTPIANEIVDRFCETKHRLSGDEWTVLWIILRKTYGWNKPKDAIPLSQFSEISGMKRQNVHRALKKLSSKKIITVIKTDYRSPLTYLFAKDYQKWELSSKKITVIKNDDKPVIKIDSNLSSKLIPSKDNTKDNIKQTTVEGLKTPSSTQDCLKYFFTVYKQKMGSDYVANFGKDGAIFKNILKVIPVEEVKRRIDDFFKSEDKFIQEAGYTIGVFSSQINKLIKSEVSELNRIRTKFGLKKE